MDEPKETGLGAEVQLGGGGKGGIAGGGGFSLICTWGLQPSESGVMYSPYRIRSLVGLQVVFVKV